MNLLLGIQIGLREILSHKFRSFLTMLGVILGVSSMMAMFALTEGIARGMKETLNLIGGIEQVNIINKEVSAKNENLADISPGRTLADAYAIRKNARFISHVSPIKSLPASLSNANARERFRVDGVLPDFLAVDTHQIKHGRSITDLDVERSHRVIVLGSSVVERLWPGQTAFNPVGEIVFINEMPYQVVGTFIHYEREADKRRRASGRSEAAERRREARGGSARGWSPFQRKNETVVIPLTTLIHDFQSTSVGEDGVDYGPNLKLDDFEVRIASIEHFDAAITEMQNILYVTHRGIDDFGFNTREDWFDNIQASERATRISGMLIAGISLLVGGIGITNIMLASITERIREIGVRRAVGARQRDIFSQILVESAVIGMLGGLLGLISGFALVGALEIFAPSDNAPVVTFGAVIISFAFAVGVGILSGIYPAWKASSLDPILALRYE